MNTTDKLAELAADDQATADMIRELAGPIAEAYNNGRNMSHALHKLIFNWARDHKDD